MANYPTGPNIGASFTQTNQGRGFAPLTVQQGEKGEWMQIIAGEVLATGNVCHIAASGTATLITGASAKTAGQVGIAQNAFAATGDTGWLQMSGVFDFISTTATVTINSRLYVHSETAGVLVSATGSASVEVLGLRNSATGSGATLTTLPGISNGRLIMRFPVP